MEQKWQPGQILPEAVSKANAAEAVWTTCFFGARKMERWELN